MGVHRLSVRWVLRAIVPVGGVVIWALTSPTFGSLTAQIANLSQVAGTSATLLTAVDTASASTDCSSNVAPISAVPSQACLGSTLPPSVPASGVATQQVTLSASGGSSPTVAGYSATGCGPVALADGTASADPMLVRGGVSYARSGPLSGSVGLGLDGSSGLAADIVPTTTGLLGSTFSVGIWFKVASGYSGGGSLIGFGSSPSTVSDTNADKILSMTTAGKLNFAIAGTLGTTNLTSPATYNDGSWHLAVATVSTLVLTSITLYVDGSQVAQSGGLTLLTGYSGYWHVGWSPVASGSPYLAGTISDAFVVNGTALSGAQVTALAGAAAQAGWTSALTADGASETWGLGDSGMGTYTGTLPLIGATDPCTMIAVAVSGAAFCIYAPNSGASACAAPAASSQTLAQWAAAGTQSFPATVTGSAATITTTVIRGSTYNATFMPGLRLSVPVTITEQLAASSPWYTTLTWTSTRQQLTA